MINLCINKEKCCGCGACYVICPKQAIIMKKDEYGFVFPSIDEQKCIECGMCIKICNYSEPSLCEPKECFAAVNINGEQLKQSASGGVFSAIASDFLNEGGIVCGAAIVFNEGKASVNHVMIDSISKLHSIQGSKYVQSYTHKVYAEILKVLKQGKPVLFSGTPCQVEAVKSLVGEKYMDNLYTIDVICHGVPSQAMFNDYLDYEAEQRGILIEQFCFRDKQNGWGLNGSIVGRTNEKKGISDVINSGSSSYYHYFLNGDIYRNSCYKCPYAQKARAGDITIGDYWGVEKYSPEILNENDGEFSVKDGISCLLVNTDKGKNLLDKYGKYVRKEKVDFSKIAITNAQLNHPLKLTSMRSKLLETYRNEGYSGIDQIYKKWKSKERVYNGLKEAVKFILPDRIILIIKKIVRK